MRGNIFRYSAIAILVSTIMSSCATTTLTSGWKDSNYRGNPLKKVLILGVMQDDTLNHLFEDEFARQLKAKGTDAVPSYTVLPEDTILDKEIIARKMKELGMDSVLIARLVDVKNVGPFYTHPEDIEAGFYTYYVHCCQTVTLGYSVVIESKIFDAKNDKLIWSAVSETSIEHTSENIIKSSIPAIIKNLHDRNLLK